MTVPLALKETIPSPDKDSATCTIIGTARCVHEDIARYGIAGDVMVISHALAYLHGLVHHAVSMHWDLLARPLLQLREVGQKGNVLCLHSWRTPVRTTLANNHVWRAAEPKYAPRGSGHFALLVAWSLGYSDIRLLGVPMDDSSHFYDLAGSTSGLLFPDWCARWIVPEKTSTRIRSASGYTRKRFGPLQESPCP